MNTNFKTDPIRRHHILNLEILNPAMMIYLLALTGAGCDTTANVNVNVNNNNGSSGAASGDTSSNSTSGQSGTGSPSSSLPGPTASRDLSASLNWNVTTFAGGFQLPFQMAFGPISGNLYVADALGNVIWAVDPSGNVSIYAGTASQQGYLDGPRSSAYFYFPVSVAVDANENVFVADMYNHVIREISFTDGNVSTLAGVAGSYGGSDTPTSAGSALFLYPDGVAVDTISNSLYVVEYANNAVRKIDLNSGMVATFAGQIAQSGFRDGVGKDALFNCNTLSINAVKVDHSGNVYVADSCNNAIRMIDPSGNVSTLAGNGGAGFLDGPGASAQFNNPCDIAVDGVGNVFVADSNNNTIRMISPSGEVSTPSGATFNFPVGLAISPSGYLFESDLVDMGIHEIQ